MLLISLFVCEYVLMLNFFGYSHCVSITFVGAGFSHDLRLVRVDRPHVPRWSQMLTAYSAQGSTHYHEDYSMSETEMVLLGVLYTST